MVVKSRSDQKLFSPIFKHQQLDLLDSLFLEKKISLENKIIQSSEKFLSLGRYIGSLMGNNVTVNPFFLRKLVDLEACVQNLFQMGGDAGVLKTS